MAFNNIPQTTGYMVKRLSSMDKRAIGKFTDSNHLGTLRSQMPTHYDKAVISLYTQTRLYSNDLLQMLNKSTPFYLTSNSDSWDWEIESPYKFPVIVGVPSELNPSSNVGIDGQPFYLILDTDEFFKHEVITPHRMYGPDWSIIEDPIAVAGGFLYKLTLNSATPQTDFVDPQWLQPGLELHLVNNSIGEFDTDLPGLGRLGEKLTLMDSLSSGYGVKHQITDWADARPMKDSQGRPLDLVVYQEYRLGANGKKEIIGERWEPLIEQQLRKKMLSLKVERMIWSKGGTQKSQGKKQEIKRLPVGIYHKIRNNGNLVQYNRGQFSLQILRNVFGDLFYRRIPMSQRRVKLYTNEAGFRQFEQASLEDLRGAGFTLIPDGRFIEGSGRNMMVSYAFSSMYSTETGRVDVVHLMELDLPQTNAEFGQNKMSTPLYIVFDVSDAEGGLTDNIREVRHKSRPSMTWGYIDGAISHLGFAASQGMQSASMDPWYTLWFKDRADAFIEDATRCIVIEERPQW